MSRHDAPPMAAWATPPAPPAPAYPYGCASTGIAVPRLSFPVKAPPPVEPESETVTVLRDLLTKRRIERETIANKIAANQAQVASYEEMVATHRRVVEDEIDAAEVVDASIAGIIADIVKLGGEADD